MDELDYLILGELLEDSQISFLAIARKLEVSSLTVKHRFDKMKSRGVIRKCIVNIDLSRLGYQGKAFLFITSAHNMAKSVTMDALKRTRNIIVVSEIVGPFDILAIAPITDLDSIRTLVNQIKDLPSVQRVQIACINDTMFPVNETFDKVLAKQSRALANSRHSGKEPDSKS